MKIIALALVPVLLLTACTSKENLLEINHSTPGYQYIIGDAKGVIENIATGAADVSTHQRMTGSDTMALFSMTKTFTAMAILKLAEQERLSLDDSVNNWVSTPYSELITIRHLITHTSGIPNPIPLDWVHTNKEHLGFDADFYLDKLLKEHNELKFEPGSEYLYSNIGYWLLGKIVQRASNESYQSYVTKTFFAPLGLTTKEISFEMDSQSLAKGYLNRLSIMGLISPFLLDDKIKGENLGRWTEINPVYVNGPSYGGLFANASAVFTVLRELLKEEQMLLSNSSKELLFRRQLSKEGKPINMTLGWHIGEAFGQNYLFKEGGGAGFHSEMRIYPQMEIASVLIANRTSFDVNNQLSVFDSFHIEQK